MDYPNRDKIAAALLLGFVVGISVHSIVDLGSSFSIFLLVLGVGLSVLERRGTIMYVAVLCLGSALGLFRYDMSGPVAPIHVPLGEQISVQAVVDREPDEKEKNTNIVVVAHSLNGSTVESSFLVLVSLPTYPKYRYGDVLTLRGKLQVPENFDASFDWVGYLTKEGISYQMVRPQVSFVRGGAGNPVKAALFTFKNSFLSNLNRVLPDPHAAFLGSLLIGSKASPLGTDITDQFRRAGVSHVISLSGYNLTVVADAVMRLLVFLPRAASFSLGALGVVLFSLMAGASATVVRAALMSVIVIVARVSGHTYDMSRALLVAAALMLLQNPRILVFDLSFQLSFLATVGILFGPPILLPYLTLLSERFDLRAMVATTLSAEIAVLPLILHLMGTFSVVGLFVNVLILPLIPLTMLLGFLTGMTGFLAVTIALPFAYASYLLLNYELAVVRACASLPFAQFEVHISLFLMFAFYAALVALVVWWYRAHSTVDKPVGIS